MSAVASVAQTFGTGGEAPYSVALRNGGGSLRILDRDTGAESLVEMARFLAEADHADRSVIARCAGTTIDLGCGPGRLVRACIAAGHLTLGVDAEAAAVELAQQWGLPVLHRSVFEALPREGGWDTALLIDGNIGIGGDPEALLARCAQLLSPGGQLLVEVCARADTDRTFEAVVLDDAGRRSEQFPWAEVGATGLERYLHAAGLRMAEQWAYGSRTFVRAVRA